jgi:hypothetical protein
MTRVLLQNFAWNPGQKQLEFMTSSKIKAPYESDGDEDSISLNTSLKENIRQ